MRIGLISDTHNYLDPRIAGIFSGVDYILHAGDVGLPLLLAELEQLAPVTAVLGNTDEGLTLNETEVVTLADKKFLLHHIVTPGVGSPRIAGRLKAEQPDVVMFGHTHKPFAEKFGRTLFINPGYAGRQRFDLPRSVCLLEVNDGEIRHEFVML